jgi:hypothetical protein
MEVSDKLVYIVGPAVALIALYIRYRWKKQDQTKHKQEKKDNHNPFGQNISDID